MPVVKEYPRPTLEQLNQLGELGELVCTKLNEPGYPFVVAVNTGEWVLPWWVMLGVEMSSPQIEAGCPFQVVDADTKRFSNSILALSTTSHTFVGHNTFVRLCDRPSSDFGSANMKLRSAPQTHEAVLPLAVLLYPSSVVILPHED